MKYLVVLSFLLLTACTTIKKGDFSYMSTKDVSVEFKKKSPTDIEISINTKSSGKKELMQGFIEALK